MRLLVSLPSPLFLSLSPPISLLVWCWPSCRCACRSMHCMHGGAPILAVCRCGNTGCFCANTAFRCVLLDSYGVVRTGWFVRGGSPCSSLASWISSLLPSLLPLTQAQSQHKRLSQKFVHTLVQTLVQTQHTAEKAATEKAAAENAAGPISPLPLSRFLPSSLPPVFSPRLFPSVFREVNEGVCVVSLFLVFVSCQSSLPSVFYLFRANEAFFPLPPFLPSSLPLLFPSVLPSYCPSFILSLADAATHLNTVWQTRAHSHKHNHAQRRKQRRRRLLLKEKELLVSSLSLLPHPPFSAPLPPSIHPSIPPSLLSLSSTYRHAPCPLNRSLLSIYTPRAHTHTNTELKHSGQGSSREEGWR